MSLCAEIAADILFNCDYPPVAGIEQKIILINRDDIDSITYDVTYPGELATLITLKTGKTGYLVQGIKQVMKYSNEFLSETESVNAVRHSILGVRVYDPSVNVQKAINNFINGANVVAVVEKKWKGIDNENAFRIFGLTHGLELSEMTDASDENDGTFVFSLTTPEGYKEPKVPHQLLITDYATTRTAFDNKFAA